MSSKNDTTASGEAENRAPDGPAVGPDRSAPVQSDDRRLGRRTFIKGLGATAATGVALGLDDGPVQESEAVLPVLAAGLVAGAVAGAAFGATFAGPDSGAVEDAQTYQNHVREYTRAREDSLIVDQTLASLKRDVQLVENKAREQAIFKIFEAGVDNLSQADATANAEAAINESYAVVEQAILTSWNIRFNRAEQVYGTSLVADGSKDVLAVRDTSGQSYYPVGGGGFINLFTDTSTKNVTLLNGDTIQLSVDYFEENGDLLWFDPTTWPTMYDDGSGADKHRIDVRVPDPASYSVDETNDFTTPVTMLNTVPFADAYRTLLDEHSAMMAEVSSMVDSYYQAAADGEIDLYEAVGPQHLTDTAKNPKDYAEASLALRALGYPMSKQVVTIEVPDKNSDTPIELTGRLSWTAHNGNSLDVGQSHNADLIPGSVYAAVNLPDNTDSLLNSTSTNTSYTASDTGPGAEIVELTGDFTIVSAEGAGGVTFETRNLASSATSNEEITQIYKENFTANKEATETVHDTATGGGGGWSGLSSSGKGLLVAAAGAVGYGFLKGN